MAEKAIKIGYGDDAGFTGAPGLNHEMSDAVEALTAWCNDQGGINGRKIEATYLDAKITEVNNVMLNACRSVFMLVGQGWSLDSAQEETRLECKLPAVPAFTVSPEFAHGDLMIQPVPNPVDVTSGQIAKALADLHPRKVKQAAAMYANYAATLDTRDKYKSAFPKFGFDFLNCDQEYNIAGEADWKPFAQKLKDCGAEVVTWIGSPHPNFQNYLDAAAQVGFDPIYLTDANFYEKKLAAWNTNGHGDNVYARLVYAPFEEADQNPATADYLEIVEGNGGDVSLLGMQAASAFLLWATAADACGADLTRACVLEELAEIEEWSAGGLHVPTSPATNMPPQCGMVMRLQGTTWVRAYPEEGFDCSPEYVAPVSGAVVERAALDEDRVSRAVGG